MWSHTVYSAHNGFNHHCNNIICSTTISLMCGDGLENNKESHLPTRAGANGIACLSGELLTNYIFNTGNFIILHLKIQCQSVPWRKHNIILHAVSTTVLFLRACSDHNQCEMSSELVQVKKFIHHCIPLKQVQYM